MITYVENPRPVVRCPHADCLRGSDGAIERKNGQNVWAAVETAVAIEGTRFVLLRPGQEYHFIAHVSGASRPGTYRVSITYRSTINDEERATIGRDYSAGFDIR